MLESILRICTTLIVSGKCCKDLAISESMIEKFNVDMYHDVESSNPPLDNAVFETLF